MLGSFVDGVEELLDEGCGGHVSGGKEEGTEVEMSCESRRRLVGALADIEGALVGGVGSADPIRIIGPSLLALDTERWWTLELEDMLPV